MVPGHAGDCRVPEAETANLCAGMIAALTACKGHPTVLVDTEHLRVDLRFARELSASLTAAGVVGLSPPQPTELYFEITGHMKSERKLQQDDAATGIRLSESQVRLA